MSRDERTLAMWTVYDRPHDHPNTYVARCFYVDAGGTKASPHAITSHELGDLRAMFVAMGLTRVPREQKDDPKIVETWM